MGDGDAPADHVGWSLGGPMLRQPDGDNTSGDLVSEVGNEIKVALDRWSIGQLGLADLVVAGGVLLVGALLAWLASRVAKRLARRRDGVARAAIATIGLLIGSSIVLFAVAIALEVLGFSLGPILVLIMLVVAALLLLRPVMTNLSSGLLLQARAAVAAGDLVLINGVLGKVREINARSVVVETADGRTAHIPNSDVVDETIENYSALGRRRSSFDLTLEAVDDLDRAVAVLEDVVGSADGVLDEPPPAVDVVGVVGRFVVLRVLVWHAPWIADERATVTAAVRRVVAGCADEGISLNGPELLAVDPLRSAS
jgi:small-conductance mechanosensitive channel